MLMAFVRARSALSIAIHRHPFLENDLTAVPRRRLRDTPHRDSSVTHAKIAQRRHEADAGI